MAAECFEPLKLNKLYEISLTYPYVIRKKSNHENVEFSTDVNGHVVCVLVHGIKKKENKVWRLSRIVAYQWLKNPNNWTHVVHLDGDKTNNEKSNLEWCESLEGDDIRGQPVPLYQYRTVSIRSLPYSAEAITAQGNTIEMVVDLPDHVISVSHYKERQLAPDMYYYDPKYKRLIVRVNKRGYMFQAVRSHHPKIKYGDKTNKTEDLSEMINSLSLLYSSNE